MNGENPSSVPMILTRSDVANIFNIEGSSPSLRASNIIIRNLTIWHAEWFCPSRTANCDGQGGTFLTTAAVLVNYANSISLLSLTVEHIGSYAIWATYSSEVMVDSVLLNDLGSGGVRIGVCFVIYCLKPSYCSKDQKTDGAFCSNNTVQNSCMMNGGLVIQGGGTGILAQKNSFNKYINNEVAFMFDTAISIG